MLEVTIKITGKTTEDVAIALEEVKGKIDQGYVTGWDSNDSGGYHFTLSDTEDA